MTETNDATTRANNTATDSKEDAEKVVEWVFFLDLEDTALKIAG